jgi:AraC-like DNA-binding protein
MVSASVVGMPCGKPLLSAESAVIPPIRKLQTWLPEHLTEDLSVPALARRAAMSLRTFQRIFTQEIGKAPSLYVEELRIEGVRRKLECTSLRLGEIAEQCGFASSDVMTRRFRFHLKVKPLDYRARFRSSVGPGNGHGQRSIASLKMRVSFSPVEVGEKQDDHESASGLELLEEPGQDIAKNKTFYSG